MSMLNMSCSSDECKNDAGEWKRVDMTLKAASQVSKTRGLRTTMSMSRVKLAKAAQPGECIAMESAYDEEGFRWWLAKAEGPAVQYTPGQEEDGEWCDVCGWWLLHFAAPLREFSAEFS